MAVKKPLMSLEQYSRYQDPKTYKTYLDVNGGNRGFEWKKALMIPAAAFGGSALSSILSPASIPSVGAAAAKAAGATAPAATAGRLSSILGSRALETGINAGLSLFGMRSQNKGNEQARKDTLMANAKALELEERRLADAARNADLDREDARALNAAMQALEQKKFMLQQEQLNFERGIYEEDRGIRNAYRTSIQEPAARRMASILGL